MKNLDRNSNPFRRWEITHICGHKGTYTGFLSSAKAYAEEECAICYEKRMKALVAKLNLPELKGNVEEVEEAEYIRYNKLEYDCVQEIIKKFISGGEREKEEIWQRAIEFDAKDTDTAVFYAVALCTIESAEWWTKNWQ